MRRRLAGAQRSCLVLPAASATAIARCDTPEPAGATHIRTPCRAAGAERANVPPATPRPISGLPPIIVAPTGGWIERGGRPAGGLRAGADHISTNVNERNIVVLPAALASACSLIRSEPANPFRRRCRAQARRRLLRVPAVAAMTTV
jgi:hypothetical protein